MGRKINYRVGELIGPNKIELIKDLLFTTGKHRVGLFKYSRCNSIFKKRFDTILSGETAGCKPC